MVVMVTTTIYSPLQTDYYYNKGCSIQKHIQSTI